MTETQFTPNPMELLGRMFSESEDLRASLGRQADGFWRAQTQVLEGMESLARSWFERRQAGATESLQAAQAMCGSTNAVDAVQAYQRWLHGSFERMAADSVEAQAQLMKLSQAWLDGMRSVALATAEAVDAKVKSAAAEAERAAQSSQHAADRRAA